MTRGRTLRHSTRARLGVLMVGLLALAPSVVGQPIRTDSSATNAALVDSTESRVQGAVLRSLAVPGWGQVYNSEAYKAPFAAGLVVGAGAFAFVQQDRYLLYRRAAYYANCLEVPGREVCDDFERRQQEWEEAGGDQFTADAYERVRDTARGNRDLGIIAVLGVYALQVVDAYVAAQLSDFDVSEDLSLSVASAPQGASLTLRIGL